jgi:hypothetical protein
MFVATEATRTKCSITRLFCFHIYSEFFKQCNYEVNTQYRLPQPDRRNVWLSHWLSYISCAKIIQTLVLRIVTYNFAPYGLSQLQQLRSLTCLVICSNDVIKWKSSLYNFKQWLPYVTKRKVTLSIFGYIPTQTMSLCTIIRWDMENFPLHVWANTVNL